jgi:hypothetical protein
MSEQRTSTRTRKQNYTTEQLSRIAAEQLETGYDAFKATETSASGSLTQDCQASLTYVLTNETTSDHTDGDTKNGRGHAEMDAIHQFSVNKCRKDLATFTGATKSVSCTDRPCCVRCSAVMGLLSIRAETGTMKTRSTKGSTEWCVSPDVRDLLRQVTGEPADAFLQFGSLKLPSRG